MDSQGGQRANGKWIPGPLDALAQRGIGGAVSLFVQSVDLNDILGRVDVNALLDHVDINHLIQRVDVNAVLARVDLDALLARVDLDALIERMDLHSVIARSSAEAAGDAVDEVREEARRLGDAADRWTEHMFHHDPGAEPPPVQ